METSTISWILENRILYVKRPDVASVRSLEKDSETIISMLDAGEEPVHIIHDTLSVNITPRNVKLIRKATNFLEHSHLGWFVTISSNSFISFLGSVVPQMRMSNKTTIKVVATVDEALSFLRKHDQTIDWDAVHKIEI